MPVGNKQKIKGRGFFRAFLTCLGQT